MTVRNSLPVKMTSFVVFPHSMLLPVKGASKASKIWRPETAAWIMVTMSMFEQLIESSKEKGNTTAVIRRMQKLVNSVLKLLTILN